MSDELYQKIALAMRYWFALLGPMIVLGLWLWQRRDKHRHRRKLRDLPDAGTIGDLLVLQGSQELPDGTSIPLPYEGILGSLRTCDLVVPCEGVAARHLRLSYKPSQGILVEPLHALNCFVDDEEVLHKSGVPALAWHGSILTVGEAKLRVRFFRGLDAPMRARLMDDPDDEPPSSPAENQEPGAQPPPDGSGSEPIAVESDESAHPPKRREGMKPLKWRHAHEEET